MSLVLGSRCSESVILCEKDLPLFFAYCSSLLITYSTWGHSFNPVLIVAARINTLTSPNSNTKTRIWMNGSVQGEMLYVVLAVALFPPPFVLQQSQTSFTNTSCLNVWLQAWSEGAWHSFGKHFFYWLAPSSSPPSPPSNALCGDWSPFISK